MRDLFFTSIIFLAVVGWSVGTAIIWYQNRKSIQEQEKRETEKLKERNT